MSERERTCIICGAAAASREHVFPAALGGRRTNKGIYCGTHNNAYSGLAGELSTQLRAINAFIGVRGDHASDVQDFVATDRASNMEIVISASRSEFKAPRILENRDTPEGRQVDMAFANHAQANEWLAQQRERGVEFAHVVRGKPQQFFLSDVHISMTLGGENGLRAIGYVAQTFLAHYYPALARSTALDGFKAYTLGSEHGSVWWDFDPWPDLPPNPFDFGHRIIVGQDAERAHIYARVSLFSTLNFAMTMGTTDGLLHQSTMVDIDPLAEHPPNDIVEHRFEHAVAPVVRPVSFTAALAEVVHDGRAQDIFSSLMRKIQERDLYRAADELLLTLSSAGNASGDLEDAAASMEAAIPAQRMLSLARTIVNELKYVLSAHPPAAVILDALVRPDAKSPNGLSSSAEEFLALVVKLTALELVSSQREGRLTRDRVAMLIGGGEGAGLITKLASDLLQSALFDE
jgi:hypothetical protein